MACRHRTVRIQGNVRSSMEGRQHSSVSENIVGSLRSDTRRIKSASRKHSRCSSIGSQLEDDVRSRISYESVELNAKPPDFALEHNLGQGNLKTTKAVDVPRTPRFSGASEQVLVDDGHPTLDASRGPYDKPFKYDLLQGWLVRPNNTSLRLPSSRLRKTITFCHVCMIRAHVDPRKSPECTFPLTNNDRLAALIIYGQFRREWTNPFKGAKGRLADIKREQAKLQRDKKQQIDQIVASMYGRYASYFIIPWAIIFETPACWAKYRCEGCAF
eukprot:318959-Prorocentrum_minimum.AAC.3